MLRFLLSCCLCCSVWGCATTAELSGGAQQRRSRMLALEASLSEGRGTEQEPELLLELGKLQLEEAHAQARLLAEGGGARRPELELSFSAALSSALASLTELDRKHRRFERADETLAALVQAYDLGQRPADADRALRTLQDGYPDSPVTSRAAVARGDAEMQRGNFEGAYRAYDGTSRSDRALWLYARRQRAWALFNLQRIPEAADGMSEVLEYLHRHPEVAEGREDAERDWANVYTRLEKATAQAALQDLVPFTDAGARQRILGHLARYFDKRGNEAEAERARELATVER